MKTGMPSLHRRRDRVRMQNFRAKRRKLGRFIEPDLLDQQRAVYDARIRREHSVDVGPDLDRIGVQRGADQRSAIVRSAASKSRRDSILVAPMNPPITGTFPPCTIGRTISRERSAISAVCGSASMKVDRR